MKTRSTIRIVFGLLVLVPFMVCGSVLFAAAALAVTNAPSSFSTMVERTVVCPVVTEPKVGIRFDLDLPQSLDCRVEVALGHDANGDGTLSDEESKIAFSWSCNSVVVIGRDGEVKALAGYVPNGQLLAFAIKPGKGTMPSFWQLAESGSAPFCAGSFGPEIRVPDFNLARIRITGPSASRYALLAFFRPRWTSRLL